MTGAFGVAAKKKITLKDIASKSGFSITTVSHVINKTRHVDSETRDIIRKTIEELNYSPTTITAKRKSMKTIGFVVADIRVDYFNEIITDIKETASQHGYNILFSESSESEEKERECLEMFIAQHVDGIILAPTNCNSNMELLRNIDIPLILIDRDLFNLNYDFVCIDNYKSGYEATKLLMKYGAKSIGFIGFDDSNYTTLERCKGFKSALHEAGLYHEDCIMTSNYHSSTDSITEKFRAFLLENNKKEGIVCASNNICFELIYQAEELSIKIPDDLLVISYDDNKWFEFVNKSISAIKQPTGDIAVVATELLINKINQRNDNIGNNINLRQKIILDYTIVDRFKK